MTFRTFELYSVLALYFLLLTSIWGGVMRYVEWWMDRGALQGDRPVLNTIITEHG